MSELDRYGKRLFCGLQKQSMVVTPRNTAKDIELRPITAGGIRLACAAFKMVRPSCGHLVAAGVAGKKVAGTKK
jgi:hypothetical protein